MVSVSVTYVFKALPTLPFRRLVRFVKIFSESIIEPLEWKGHLFLTLFLSMSRNSCANLV